VSALALSGVLLLGGTARASLAPVPQTWWQADDRVDAIITANGLTYVAGRFSTLTPPGGSSSTPALGVAAFDGSGVVFEETVAASGGAQVNALTISRGVLYAGGTFSKVNGQPRRNLAAFDALTGTLLGFNPSPNFTVNALSANSTTVFVGGTFTRANGVRRSHLASYTHPNSTHWNLTPWNPGASGVVNALLVVPRGVLVGGTFRTVGGASRTNLALLNPSTGVPRAWSSQSPFATVLAFARTGNLVVAALGGQGGSAAGYLQTNGEQLWKTWTDGNVTAVTVADGQAVIGGHFRNICPQGIVTTPTPPGYMCGDNQSIPRDHVAALDLATGALDPNWAPVLNSKLGVFAALGTPRGVQLGGDFTWIGSSATPANHLALFDLPADTAPPVITQAPTITIQPWSQLAMTAIPVRAAYAATDDASGVCGYTVSQSPPFRNPLVTPPWPDAPWVNAWMLPNGAPTTFTVSATDCAGNAGSAVAGAPVSVTSRVRTGISFHGPWKFVSSPIAFNHVHAVTARVGASATLTFTGTEVALVAERGSWNQVSVHIDGHYRRTINLFSRIRDGRRVVFTASWPTAGTHTITIALVRSGAKPHINLDRFLVVR